MPPVMSSIPRETAERAQDPITGRKWWIQSASAPDDSSTEHLMTACNCRGHPIRRAVVLRLSPDEMRLWNEQVQLEERSWKQEFAPVKVMPLSMLGMFVLVSYFTSNPVYGLVAMLLPGLLSIFPEIFPNFRQWKSAWREEVRTLKQRALVRFDVNIDDVGDAHNLKKIIIAPIGWRPA